MNGQDPLFILETERLMLRRQQASDVTILTNLWADPEVTRYLGGPRERSWLQSVFEETAKNPFSETYDLWPVVEKKTGLLIGHCGLLEKEIEGKPEIELNYIFFPSMWGRGYATEMGQAIQRLAFTQMGLKRLVALIAPGNQVSERVAVKVGMHFEKEIVRPGGATRKLYIVAAGDGLIRRASRQENP
jgi:[ribosomal protein S5]-alanine N-acetyltransferase